jgi:UDP-N-acetylmuramyl pentapeptide phosphotransferase/UDP-N-acetylglucosamine-1-phosphate transferase
VIVLACAGLALLVSALGTHRFSQPGSRLFVLDHPNERSLHEQPVPRSGGVAIVSATGAALLLASLATPLDRSLAWIAGGALLVAAVSFLDDRVDVPPLHRFGVHVAAAALLLAGGLRASGLGLPAPEWGFPAVVGIVFTVLFVVWMTNLYNFMDGMDGFAGGMGVLGFGALALLGWLAGHAAFTLAAAVVAAACAGFLVFNFPPARIFMGDVGSSTLGFLAAALALWGSREGIFPLWTAVLVFSPFIVDATVTLLRRLLRGERVWEAHRTHYYQRLVRMGWGHRRTVLREYLLMAACAASAVGAGYAPPAGQWGVLLGWVVVYLALARLVAGMEAGRARADRGALPAGAAGRGRPPP